MRMMFATAPESFHDTARDGPCDARTESPTSAPRRLHPGAALHALRLRQFRGRAPPRRRRGGPQPSHPVPMERAVRHDESGGVELWRDGPAERAPVEPARLRLRGGDRRPRRRDGHVERRDGRVPEGGRRRPHPAGGGVHRCPDPAPRRPDERLPLLRQLVPPRRLPGAVRGPRAGIGPARSTTAWPSRRRRCW